VWVRCHDRTLCMARREASSVSSWRFVECDSKSFSPRLGSDGCAVSCALSQPSVLQAEKRSEAEYPRELVEEAEVLCFLCEINVGGVGRPQE
jgi:hypothetical protein